MVQKKIYHNYYDSVDFIHGTGSLHGVKIVIPLDNATKLSKDLKHCITLAKKHKQKKVEIDAHFGARGKNGFKLELKIAQPADQG